jgi:hypothetical protein
VTTSKNDYDLLSSYIQELEQIIKKVLAEEPGGNHKKTSVQQIKY